MRGQCGWEVFTIVQHDKALRRKCSCAQMNQLRNHLGMIGTKDPNRRIKPNIALCSLGKSWPPNLNDGSYRPSYSCGESDVAQADTRIQVADQFRISGQRGQKEGETSLTSHGYEVAQNVCVYVGERMKQCLYIFIEKKTGTIRRDHKSTWFNRALVPRHSTRTGDATPRKTLRNASGTGLVGTTKRNKHRMDCPAAKTVSSSSL